jgi:hypothetical protein
MHRTLRPKWGRNGDLSRSAEDNEEMGRTMRILRMNRLALLRWVALANMIACGAIIVCATTVVDSNSGLGRAIERVFFVLGFPLVNTLSHRGIPGADNPYVLLVWLGGALILNAYLWGASAWLAILLLRKIKKGIQPSTPPYSESRGGTPQG